ncbi:MAG: Serine dehydratase alpha chain [Firmicutes bacterium ADurb.Bin248]|jgi:L-cysteine desulfidase|nr:MAG: Serine dehydratase alpha chain [Firmicutes bacterium ADurb.Bin248]HOG01966.1 L-serine ammonia-lyase, iron-sulfur-dependent, subunit alpha [Clostridia bacterium]HPK16347.1 L-serine ammonia-lyase, iron-sulfur-dependent, subunit alpha [Clostridia bacterium]
MYPGDEKYRAYCDILNNELAVALGCTEPIALAYAAALARELLGGMPDACALEVCGNIIKNAKSVVVPNTGGLKGIPAAIAAGLVAGRSEDRLEVLSRVTREDRERITAYLAEHEIALAPSETDKSLYIDVRLSRGEDTARVVVADAHTNVARMEKNGVVLLDADEGALQAEFDREYGLLNVADICDFADTVDLSDVGDAIRRQIRLNSAISAEGLENGYGAQIGRVLLRAAGDGADPYSRCQAAAAAGSDARMSGCEMPVVIVSGSGNQGITASLPVIEYARLTGAGEDALLRALVLSDLVTIHQKTGIGKLSAYCGAVCAGVGAACGVAYLDGGDADVVSHTIVNGLAITSGIVCDGAKPSCAAKIATAVYSGLLGYEMYKNGQQFYAGDGIVTKGADNTIKNVGRLAREGMCETDREILRIMTGPNS